MHNGGYATELSVVDKIRLHDILKNRSFFILKQGASMLISELQDSVLIGSTDKELQLSVLLYKATRETREPFAYMDIVRESPASGRVISQKRILAFPTFIALPKKYTHVEMSVEFFNQTLARQLRYDPAEPISGSVIKGWEVRSAQIDKQTVVLLLATWI